MDEKNYRKGEKYMKQNRPNETGFEKMSDEELSRKVKHYENIERIGGK